MAFGIDDAVTAVAGIGGKLIDRLWPDPTQAAAAKLELLKMQESGELSRMTLESSVMKAQIDVNAQEAQSDNVFVAGWRPSVGWVCTAGLAMQYVVAPFLTWIATLVGHPVTFPQLDMNTLLPLLLGMLGLGAMRTYEKVNSATDQGVGH